MSKYHIETFNEYLSEYQESINNTEKFWSEIAENNFVWYKKWNKVLQYDFSKPEIEWFEGAKLNITENCIDRHLAEKGDQIAIIFEPNDHTEQCQSFTYRVLHQQVCKFANVLKDSGVNKGDRVIIYLPMIPELAIAVLACARIGAVHSVVFAGFSATALSTRIIDCGAELVITSDGAYRGNKTIELKSIVDEALEDCPHVSKILVVKRTNTPVTMKKDRDIWVQELLDRASDNCQPEIMDAEDPLFILYTSGSTGKPKGMLHTIAGYMVYTAYTFKNVFQYQDKDIYWCTADIGWITGHSYIIYGPLTNGATTLMFEGVPSCPDHGRFWEIIEKHKVNQFYTAPTAIRALAKEGAEWPNKYNLASLKVLGTVGEPINEEAWSWYDDHIGKNNCPIVDTWWQTETGGILITPLPNIIPTKPTFATLPLPGIIPVLVDDQGNEICGNEVSGNLCIAAPWPSIARTIWGDHQRYRDTYFSAYEGKYFTGDGALRDESGYYRITGRVDDIIIVSGHNLGTGPIEDAINTHPLVAESAIVGFPHDIKGNALYGFITLKSDAITIDVSTIRKEINDTITSHVGAICKLEKIQFVNGLPKTRSGKIMRRILRKIAYNDLDNMGDISTLLNPEVVTEIVAGAVE